MASKKRLSSICSTSTHTFNIPLHHCRRQGKGGRGYQTVFPDRDMRYFLLHLHLQRRHPECNSSSLLVQYDTFVRKNTEYRAVAASICINALMY